MAKAFYFIKKITFTIKKLMLYRSISQYFNRNLLENISKIKLILN